MITSEQLAEAYEAFLTEGGNKASNQTISEAMGITSETAQEFILSLPTERLVALIGLSPPEAFMVGIGVGVRAQRIADNNTQEATS